MLTINATVGNEVHGIRLDQQIVHELWLGLNDEQLVAAIAKALKERLVLNYAFKHQQTLLDASHWVDQHVEEIT